MKPERTFEQKWNKTALRRIKKAYIESKKDYLCHGSEKFNELWSNHKEEIVKQMFQHFPEEEALELGLLPFKRNVLFYTPHRSNRQTRIEFLDLEIARLSNKSKPTP